MLARDASLAEHYGVWGKRKNQGGKRWKKKTYFSRLSSFTFCFHLPLRPFLRSLALSWPTQKYGLFCSLLTSLTCSDLLYLKSWFASPTISDDTSVWKCIEIRKINVIWRTWWILLQIANHFITIHIFKWSFLFLAFDKGDWSFKHLTIKRGNIKTKRLINYESLGKLETFFPEIRDAYHARFRLGKQWNSKKVKLTSFPRTSHCVLLKYCPNTLLWFNKENLGMRSTLANRLRGSFHS